jgi:hypothetical protein
MENSRYERRTGTHLQTPVCMCLSPQRCVRRFSCGFRLEITGDRLLSTLFGILGHNFSVMNNVINSTNKALMDFVEVYLPTAKVRMVKARGARVMRILRKDYEPIADLITTALEKHKELSLHRLIDLGVKRYPERQSGHLTWLIIQVKNDMEFRELIDVFIDEDRNQYIKLRHAQ